MLLSYSYSYRTPLSERLQFSLKASVKDLEIFFLSCKQCAMQKRACKEGAVLEFLVPQFLFKNSAQIILMASSSGVHYCWY